MTQSGLARRLVDTEGKTIDDVLREFPRVNSGVRQIVISAAAYGLVDRSEQASNYVEVSGTLTLDRFMRTVNAKHYQVIREFLGTTTSSAAISSAPDHPLANLYASERP
jgi:hypothetical protein